MEIEGGQENAGLDCWLLCGVHKILKAASK